MNQKIIEASKIQAFKQQFNIKLPKKITFPISKSQRPTVAQVKERFQSFQGKKFECPKTNNKGEEGQLLEQLLGIPNSSACLDCSDGELKLFPLKKLKRSKQYTAKETVAITMRGLNNGQYLSWAESDLRKKTNNMLFISYIREGDYITYKSAFLFGASRPEYAQFQSDYEKITEYYRTHGICQLEKNDPAHRSNTINGTYIQGRTKGAGKKVGNGLRTVAFYFRKTEFIKDVILQKINTKSTHQSSSPQDSSNE